MRKLFAVLAATALLSGCGADEGAYLTAVRKQANDTEYSRLTEREWLLVGEDVCLKLKAGIDSPGGGSHPFGVSWATAWFAAKDHLC